MELISDYERQGSKNVLEARAGVRLCCMSHAFGPPCLSTNVRFEE